VVAEAPLLVRLGARFGEQRLDVGGLLRGPDAPLDDEEELHGDGRPVRAIEFEVEHHVRRAFVELRVEARIGRVPFVSRLAPLTLQVLERLLLLVGPRRVGRRGRDERVQTVRLRAALRAPVVPRRDELVAAHALDATYAPLLRPRDRVGVVVAVVDAWRALEAVLELVRRVDERDRPQIEVARRRVGVDLRRQQLRGIPVADEEGPLVVHVVHVGDGRLEERPLRLRDAVDHGAAELLRVLLRHVVDARDQILVDVDAVGARGRALRVRLDDGDGHEQREAREDGRRLGHLGGPRARVELRPVGLDARQDLVRRRHADLRGVAVVVGRVELE